jgi:DNA-binding transcriptional regulator YiaG
LTPAEIRAAREALGLSQPQLAAMLRYSVKGNAAARVSEVERGKPMDAARVELLRAYLSGYRPQDWPKGD